jgi:hypothetical protein
MTRRATLTGVTPFAVNRDLLRRASEHLAGLAQEHYERACLSAGVNPREHRRQFEIHAKYQRLATALLEVIA